jgi:hypothetical protein
MSSSKIVISIRDHKGSGKTNEYQRDAPIKYIHKYVITAPEEAIKVSLTKGTTTWFPNQISLGLTSKPTEDTMDAPDLEVEADHSGSKKDYSFAELSDFKLKGVKITFQLEEAELKPKVEFFFIFRRSNDKSCIGGYSVKRIKLSHRISLEGRVEGVSVDESAIEAGIVKPEEGKGKKSSHAEHRPRLSVDEYSSVHFLRKDYGLCTLKTERLSMEGINTPELYEPSQYISCPKTISELKTLFDEPSGDQEPLYMEFDSPGLATEYSEHRFLAALVVLRSPGYTRYITENDGKFYFIGHALPEKVYFDEKFWSTEGGTNKVPPDNENSNSEDEESVYSEEDDDDDEDDNDHEEDSDPSLEEGEEIDEDELGGGKSEESAEEDGLENDEIEEDDEDEENEDDSSSSSKKRKKMTAEDLIDDEASEDNETYETSPKKQKTQEVDDIDMFELE